MKHTIRRFMLVVTVLGAAACASTRTVHTAASGAPVRPMNTAGGPTPQEPLPSQPRAVGASESLAMAAVAHEAGIPTPEPAVPQREPRMAGPTPQVPIPHHEGHGRPASYE